jgi:hypothetical protein
MRSPLEDLDELILRCRDEKARLYIAESVSSYRVGAFRSAIVAAWVAVCFDVIEKLRELSLAGDKEAEKHVHELDLTRRTGDVTRALKFERELLQLAKDKFELISPLEYVDLERLQADRNRCAHPSLTADDQAYTPSAELARLHIHSAVTHLLQHPPVQGKYALDRLCQEIESDYFPTVTRNARVFFASGPLRRPRESLVRNLVLILAKILLNEKPEWKRRMRIAAALGAVNLLHPEPFGRTLRERLSIMFRGLEDGDLNFAIKFLNDISDCWQHLDADVRQRLENYVRDLPTDDFIHVDTLLKYPPLMKQAATRIKYATKQELIESIFFDSMPKEIADRYITLYLDSRTFDDANNWAKHVSQQTAEFNVDHVRRLLTDASKNKQVRDSFQIGPLINSLRNAEKLPLDEFEKMLTENGLGEFTLAEQAGAIPF